ncbi:MAG: hypothetical protein GY913_13050 [Proteobacteria bacterium]|nr:hypothetical protein [Pseudomonadota bacterium]MCP4917835.1 hypothetical protein [Pseudomonadota bacterium]
MFLKLLQRTVLILLMAVPSAAWADTATTRDALDRLEEVLQVRIEDGRIDPEQVMPAILVSAQPRYETSQDWFSIRVIEVLQTSFGSGGLRLCEACMAPRAFVGDGTLSYQTGPVGLDEVIRLDDHTRGQSAAARTGVWVDELVSGVAIRIVDLRTGRVVFAMNIDPYLIENERSRRNYTLTQELERRARGDAITHAFVDLALYPGQHLSADFTDQWGPNNANLSGVTVSLLDPVLGIGASHYRALKLGNTLVGGKVVLSLPTALVRSFDTSDDPPDVIDPLVTGVAVVRVPFGRSNYGAVVTLSTNGQFGLGISLMNLRLLPVIP